MFISSASVFTNKSILSFPDRVIIAFFLPGITLFLPIKIAGPLFRIEQDLRGKIAEGDLTAKIKLRKGDEHSDLADAVNVCLDNFRQKIETTQKLANDLESRLSVIKGSDNKDVEDLVVKINENLKQFKV